MSGGANQNYNANTSLTPPYNQPPQKSYLDFNTSNPDNSWEITEPGIYYQASYVRLLAGIANLFDENDTLSTPDVAITDDSLTIYPNPTTDKLYINQTQGLVKVEVINMNGELVCTEIAEEFTLE